MKIELKGMKVMMDGIKSGRFYFPPNLFYIKIRGSTIRILKSRSGQLNVFLSSKGHPRYRNVATADKGIIEYGGNKLTVKYIGEDGKSRLSILDQEGKNPVAISNMDGSMEFREDFDPVLVALGTVFLCMIKFIGNSLPDLDNYVGMVYESFNGKWTEAVTLLPPLLVTCLIPVLAYLSVRFDTGTWSGFLVFGYASLIVGSVVFVVLSSLRNKTRIIKRSQINRS